MSIEKDHKRKVLILSCCMAVKNVLGDVTRSQVQALRAMPKINYLTALKFLMSPKIVDDDVLVSAKAFAKKLKAYDGVAFKRRLPALNDMYAIIPSAANFKSRVHAPEPTQVPQVPIKVHLVTLNALLKQRGLKPLAVWSGTRNAIEERIVKVRKAMEQDRSDVQRAPTVVAEGAYKSDEEAFAKTGHRFGGRRKKDEKDDARKNRFIAGRIEKLPTPTHSTHSLKLSELKGGKQLAAKVKAIKGDTITLSEIAAALNIDAKVARHKARRYVGDLKQYEVAKYIYPKAKAEAVKAILNSDNRKRK